MDKGVVGEGDLGFLFFFKVGVVFRVRVLYWVMGLWILFDFFLRFSFVGWVLIFFLNGGRGFMEVSLKAKDGGSSLVCFGFVFIRVYGLV